MVMKTGFNLLIHGVVTIAKLLRPGGAKNLVAENLALKHQLLIANRSRKKAPNLTPWDRFLLGLWAIFIKPTRIGKIAVVVSKATMLKFHGALKKRKYGRLFSGKSKGKPGEETDTALESMELIGPTEAGAKPASAPGAPGAKKKGEDDLTELGNMLLGDMDAGKAGAADGGDQ